MITQVDWNKLIEQHWLIGRNFTTVIDHRPFETMKVKTRTDGILGELMHNLSQYQLRIVYASGRSNIKDDSLSRNPVLESFENEDNVLRVVILTKLQDIVEDQEEDKEAIL